MTDQPYDLRKVIEELKHFQVNITKQILKSILKQNYLVFTVISVLAVQ